MRTRIRLTAAAALAALGLLAGATAALADSPHFISASAGVDRAGNLVATFKEAGLGSTASTEQVVAAANATASYACINGGGNHPKAANKATVSGPVSGSGAFPVRNGQTTGSITVAPPGPGGFSCPPGQALVLASVCYSSITLTGLAGDVASVPGELCRTLFAV